LEQALSDSGRRVGDVNIVLELGGNEAIKQAVLNGIGVSILSSLAVKKDLATGELHTLRITDFPLRRVMYTVADTRRALPISAQTFLQIVESWESR
jgi:DNA-binding transcriptional LysR family regulator